MGKTRQNASVQELTQEAQPAGPQEQKPKTKTEQKKELLNRKLGIATEALREVVEVAPMGWKRKNIGGIAKIANPKIGAELAKLPEKATLEAVELEAQDATPALTAQLEQIEQQLKDQRELINATLTADHPELQARRVSAKLRLKGATFNAKLEAVGKPTGNLRELVEADHNATIHITTPKTDSTPTTPQEAQ